MVFVVDPFLSQVASEPTSAGKLVVPGWTGHTRRIPAFQRAELQCIEVLSTLYWGLWRSGGPTLITPLPFVSFRHAPSCVVRCVQPVTRPGFRL